VRRYPCQKFPGGKGLDQIVVGLCRLFLHPGLLIRPGREQNDRDGGEPRVGPQRLEQGEAVEPGHHYIRQYEVRAITPRLFKGGLPVGDRLDRVT